MIFEIVLIVVMIGTTIYLGNFLHKITLPGLRTGNIQARGRYYSRSREPLRFWFCAISFILIFLMMLSVSLLGTVQVWTRLT
jgi:hypothetical protein